MQRLIPSIVVVLLASLSVQAKERISILDFMVSPTAKKSVNVDASQDLTQQVRDVATSLIDPARFEVMTRENILVMLPPGKKSLEECEGQCEVETARNLGSRWHVVGDVKKVGSKLVLSVRLYDVASGTQLGGVRMDGATVDEVNATVSPKARELLARIPGMKGSSAGDAAIANSGGAEPVGSRADAAPVLDEVGSIVTVSVSGGAASFALDGKSVCRDQETCQQELSHGKHVVKVGRSGYRDTVFSIVVPRGNNTYSLGLNPKLGVLTLRVQDEATGQALAASILLNGKEAGMTPKSLSVPLSVREIRLREKDHDDLVVTERPDQEGGKIALNLKMVRQKVSASGAASQSTKSVLDREESATKVGKRDVMATDDVRTRDEMLGVAIRQHFPGKSRKDTNMVKLAVENYNRFLDRYQSEGNWPTYRARIYLADALSFVGRHEEAADVYTWASGEDLGDPGKYREPTVTERKLTKPVDAAYNAVAELQSAASDEVVKQGGDKVKAFNQPVTKRYIAAVEDYLKRFPRSPDVADFSYNKFLFQVNGEDWVNAIVSGNGILSAFPTYRYALDSRARLAYVYTQAARLMDAEREYRNVLGSLSQGNAMLQPMTNNLGEVIWRMAEKAEKAGKVDSAVYNFRRLAREFPQLNLADSAAFRAAVALENGKRPKEAAMEYTAFERTYRGKSKLCSLALQAASEMDRAGKESDKLGR